MSDTLTTALAGYGANISSVMLVVFLVGLISGALLVLFWLAAK